MHSMFSIGGSFQVFAMCALLMSSSQPQASAGLQHLSNVPNCRHALAGCNLVSLRLSSLPKSGQQKHTCCSVRQSVPALQTTSVSSGAWGVGCWASHGWDSIPPCYMSSACGLASQTVHQPSIKQCMLSRPCMVCGYYMVTSEKATSCVYLRQNKVARLYSLI